MWFSKDVVILGDLVALEDVVVLVVALCRRCDKPCRTYQLSRGMEKKKVDSIEMNPLKSKYRPDISLPIKN